MYVCVCICNTHTLQNLCNKIGKVLQNKAFIPLGVQKIFYDKLKIEDEIRYLQVCFHKDQVCERLQKQVLSISVIAGMSPCLGNSCGQRRPTRASVDFSRSS